MDNLIDTFSKEVEIINELGLHARSAAKIAGIAQQAQSKVWLIKDGEAVDAQSVIDMLSLACAKGSQVIVKIDSPSDLPILDNIVSLVEDGFGE
jgi:phosphocarrier protein HPr